MDERTQSLWEEQSRHGDDRRLLFEAAAQLRPYTKVLYPGSFVDVAASLVFPDVTYVDSDNEAAAFFGDEAGVAEILGNRAEAATWTFHHGDYTDLALPAGSFDLVISLYTGIVTDHCSPHLEAGGHLLVNSSHGDAALASLDPCYRLAAVITNRSGTYRLGTDHLDTYLKPKRPTTLTPDVIREQRRGVAYTRKAAAYNFEKTSPGSAEA